MLKDITIGIPVYNEQLGIERAIRSCANQCEKIIVADNASTDRTEIICKKLLNEFHHLTYIRHESNMGAHNNGLFILEKVTTPFFMFMGGHDFLGVGCLKLLKEELKKDVKSVLAVPNIRVGFYENSEKIVTLPSLSYECLNSKKIISRIDYIVRTVSRMGQACLIANGLHKTKSIRESLIESSIYASDILFIAQEAIKGNILVVPNAEYHFKIRSNDSDNEYFSRLSDKMYSWNECREERAIFAKKIFILAKDTIGINPFLKLKLLNLRLFLGMYYGQFKLDSTVDCFSRNIIKILIKILHSFFVPPIGSEEWLDISLSKIISKKYIINKKIALYGAGLHSIRLLSKDIIQKRCVAIFDDNSEKNNLNNIQIYHPENAENIEFDILIISSDTIEKLSLKLNHSSSSIPISFLLIIND